MHLKDSINDVLSKAPRLTIAVLGDLMLDEWIFGAATRISQEAPVPVVRFRERKTALGGAANVALNFVRLGARVRFCGVVGADEAGSTLLQGLEESGIDIRAVLRDESRPTTVKTRIVSGRQQIVRIDREEETEISAELRKQLIPLLPAFLEGATLLCLSDYAKGLLTPEVCEAAVSGARERATYVTGGPKPRNLPCFAGLDFLSLNHQEAEESSGIRLGSARDILQAGAVLQERTRARAIAITNSAHGVTLFQTGEAPRHVPSHTVEVADGAGAGDTFLAGASLSLAAGADVVESVLMGNFAAAASVRHAGVVAVTPDEVRRIADEDAVSTRDQ
jgi:D-beta-D-heptose 7-phosphate kinase/D-beta-D-heptose 1-phosphate adenosyltransferase